MKFIFSVLILVAFIGTLKWFKIQEQVDADHVKVLQTLPDVTQTALDRGSFPAKQQLTTSIEQVGGVVDQLNLEVSPTRDSISVDGSYHRNINLWGIVKKSKTFKIEPTAQTQSYFGKIMGNARKTADTMKKNDEEKQRQMKELEKEE